MKPSSKSVYGSRYALSVIADRVATGGADAVQFISKWLPKTGVKGAAEFDVLCKIGGVPKILEVKSSYGAFRSREALRSALKRANDQWEAARLAGKVTGFRPQIIYTSPLPLNKTPPWFQDLLRNSGTDSSFNFKYEPGIPFK